MKWRNIMAGEMKVSLTGQFFIWVLSMVAIGAFNWALLSSGQRAVKEDVSRLESRMDNVDAKLNKLLTDTEVQNRINKIKLGDRWTARMQEVFQEQWFEIMHGLHPEVKHSDIPNIRRIQREHITSLLYEEDEYQ